MCVCPVVSREHICKPIKCSPPGSSVHGTFQAGILEWAAVSFSRESSPPRDKPGSPALAGRFFPTEPHDKPLCINQSFPQLFSWAPIQSTLRILMTHWSSPSLPYTPKSINSWSSGLQVSWQRKVVNFFICLPIPHFPHSPWKPSLHIQNPMPPKKR